jgi:hypothetical protein
VPAPLFMRGKGRGKLSQIETLDDAINFLGFRRFQWKLYILCAMGNFVEAIEMAMMGVLLPVLKKEFALSNTELAALGSFTTLGMLFGAVGLGRAADTHDRLRVFQFSLMVLRARQRRGRRLGHAVLQEDLAHGRADRRHDGLRDQFRRLDGGLEQRRRRSGNRYARCAPHARCGCGRASCTVGAHALPVTAPGA